MTASAQASWLEVPGGLSSGFWREVDEETAIQVRVASRVGLPILVLFLLLYAAAFPPDIQPWVTGMQGAVLLSIAVIASLRFRARRRLSRGMMILLIALYTVQVDGTLAFTQGPQDPYYYVQILANVYLICGIGIFVPWPTSWTFLLCLLPLGTELVVAARWPLAPQVQPLGLSALAVVGAMLASYAKFAIRIEDWKNREGSRRLSALERDLIAMLSHDLANPLGSVITSARFIADDPTCDARQVAGTMTWAARRALELIRNFADASSIEIDHEALRVEEVRLDTLVSGLVEQEQIRAHREQVDLSFEADGRVALRADADKVSRIVANLISNAIRHTPAAGRILVSVSGTPEGGGRVTVTDSGSGIPPEMRDRLFERFFRAAGDRKDSTGLGLYIARSFAEAHGGTVTAGDAPSGTGAMFTLSLPPAPPGASGHRR